MNTANTPAPPRVWKDRAACLTAHPDDFFPDNESNSAPRVKERFCKGCDVQTLCLEWALANDEWGVWGNTTETERKQLKKQTHQFACICGGTFANAHGLQTHKAVHCKKKAA